MNRYTLAIEDCETSVELQSTPFHYYCKATVLAETGDYNLALADLKNVTNFDNCPMVSKVFALCCLVLPCVALCCVVLPCVVLYVLISFVTLMILFFFLVLSLTLSLTLSRTCFSSFLFYTSLPFLKLIMTPPKL